MATNMQDQKASKAALPPGPGRLPYIGNLLSLRLDPLGYLQRLQRTYGNMATIYFGKNPAVLLFRPEYIRYVLRSEEHTSELQSHLNLVCRLLLEKKKTTYETHLSYTL